MEKDRADEIFQLLDNIPYHEWYKIKELIDNAFSAKMNKTPINALEAHNERLKSPFYSLVN